MWAAAVALFCRQLLLVGATVLVGQQGEKCRGHIPGVSLSAALSALLTVKSVHCRAFLGLILPESGGR